MSVLKTEVAVGEWEDRASLDYVPCNAPIPGYGYVDALGRKIPPGMTDTSNKRQSNRRPYMIETGDTATYIKYDAGLSPIFRVTES